MSKCGNLLNRTVSAVVLGGVAMLALNTQAVPHNLATNGTATVSSDGWGGVAARAIDGNRDGDWSNASVWHTEDKLESHWYEVDLGADYYLDRVLIFPRTVQGPYWNNFRIIVRDSTSSIVYSNSFLSANNLDKNWGSSDMRGVRGRTVRIQSNGTPINTSMAEFEVWGSSEPSLNNFALKAAVTGAPGGYNTTLNDLRDGDIDGHYSHPGYPLYHSSTANSNLTVRLDFGITINIDHVNLYARCDVAWWGTGLQIDVLDDTGTSIYTTTNDLAGIDLNAQRYNVTLDLNQSGRYLKLMTLDVDFIEIAEVEVMSRDPLPDLQLADILIQPDPAVTGTVTDHHPGQLGNLFKIPGGSEGYAVRALGFYDHDGDGLVQSHKVGIWYTEDNAATGTLLCEATVPAGTEAPLHFGCRWVNLETPINLSTQSVGTAWYVVGASLDKNGGDKWISAASGWRYNPSLQQGYCDRRWVEAGWNAFPNSAGGGSAIYHVANLSVTALPPPPPPRGTVIMIQ